jgi:hypothetical protein
VAQAGETRSSPLRRTSRPALARLEETRCAARLDDRDRVAMAGGAEGGIGDRRIRRGRSQIGDDPGQQRLERVGDEVKMRAELRRLVIVRRST